MNKKLIILGTILVLALFVISACQQTVGKPTRTEVSGRDSDFKQSVTVYNDDESEYETTGNRLYADGAGAYLMYIGDQLKVQTGQNVHVFELNGIEGAGRSAKLSIDGNYIGIVQIGDTRIFGRDKLTVVSTNGAGLPTAKQYAIIGINMLR